MSATRPLESLRAPVPCPHRCAGAAAFPSTAAVDLASRVRWRGGVLASWRIGLIGSLLFASSGVAQSHRGSVGVFGAGGGEVRAEVGASSAETYGAVLDLGASAAIDHNGNEVVLFVRGVPTGTGLHLGLSAAYRGYFGSDAWKTFFDVGLASDWRPQFGLGPRLGLGVQCDLHPLFGVFAFSDARVLVGGPIRMSLSFSLGVQGRSYWLE